MYIKVRREEILIYICHDKSAPRCGSLLCKRYCFSFIINTSLVLLVQYSFNLFFGKCMHSNFEMKSSLLANIQFLLKDIRTLPKNLIATIISAAHLSPRGSLEHGRYYYSDSNHRVFFICTSHSFISAH